MEAEDKVEEVVNKLDGKKKKYRMKWSQWDTESLIEASSKKEALQRAKRLVDSANLHNRGDYYFCEEVEEVEFEE